MKKIITILMIFALAVSVMAGCGSSTITVEQDTEITDFPYVTDDGRILYELVIDGETITTTDYPFTYTAESVLSQEAESIAESESVSESEAEEAATATTEETTTVEETTTEETTTVEETTTEETVDLTETDSTPTYYPVREVLDYFGIDYSEADDYSTLTTEINGEIVYLKENRATMYYGNEIIDITAPVVVDECMYATESFFNYFLSLESGFTSDKTGATLTTIAEEETTTSAYSVCPYCDGTGLITCTECGGDGYIDQYTDLYDSGTNKSWTASSPNSRLCPLCNGTGQITCPYCNGVGYIEN